MENAAWADVLPSDSEQLEKFLRDLNLVQYVDTFVDLGYDDVDAFASISGARLRKLAHLGHHRRRRRLR